MSPSSTRAGDVDRRLVDRKREHVGRPVLAAVLGVELGVAAGGVGVAALVTATGAEVAVFPAPSRATAVNVCDPSNTIAVFQVVAYGTVVSTDEAG